MLKNRYFLLLASLSSLAYASGEMEQCCDPLIPPEPIESCQVPVGYFYPAQYTFGDCGLDISLSGEFIYWELNRDSHNSLGTKTVVANNGNTVQSPLAHQLGYRPGFKVAAGMGIPGCDAWKVDVEYTWFHHTSTKHFRALENGSSVRPGFFSVLMDLRYLFFNGSVLKSVLKFDLDFIQGTLGRTFYLSERMIVNASSGLKSWWSSINSNLTFFGFNGGPSLTERSKSDLWGIGPYITAQIKGLLWCGTFLYGKVGVWIPYTRHTKLRVDTNFPPSFLPFPNNQEVKLNRYVYTTQIFYEGGVGIGWGTYLCECDYHIDFLIGYDMMTNYIIDIYLPVGDSHNEFYYQGLTVKAQFDF